MSFFKRKFSKLQRADVTNAIIDLEKQESSLESAIAKADIEIADLMIKGRSEKSKDLKLLYAKKLLHLKTEKQQYIKRATYLLYNIQMLQRLRDA